MQPLPLTWDRTRDDRDREKTSQGCISFLYVGHQFFVRGVFEDNVAVNGHRLH